MATFLDSPFNPGNDFFVAVIFGHVHRLQFSGSLRSKVGQTINRLAAIFSA